MSRAITRRQFDADMERWRGAMAVRAGRAEPEAPRKAATGELRCGRHGDALVVLPDPHRCHPKPRMACPTCTEALAAFLTRLNTDAVQASALQRQAEKIHGR